MLEILKHHSISLGLADYGNSRFDNSVGWGCFHPFFRFGKEAAKRANSASRALMLAGTFGLCFIGEHHFADRVTTGNRGIKDGHGELP